MSREPDPKFVIPIDAQEKYRFPIKTGDEVCHIHYMDEPMGTVEWIESTEDAYDPSNYGGALYFIKGEYGIGFHFLEELKKKKV